MDGFDRLLLVLALAYVAIAPWCKVEESFALQATHDFLHAESTRDVETFDHRAFPGVVPRTCVPSLALAVMSWVPVRAIQMITGGAAATKASEQVVTRMVLAFVSVRSYGRFREGVNAAFGSTVSAFTAIACAVEFHCMFYASRPLMNVFANACAMRGLGCWIRATATRNERCVDRGVVLLTVATFLLRCDVVLMLGAVGLHMLATRLISFRRAVWLGGGTALMTIATSVIVDSWFWGELVWPEGAVLYYNTALNKSSNWGTSPWHWYFSSALPKSLLFAYPLALVSVFFERRVRPVMFVCAFYVGLYSFLPHKELRFIFPTLPLFNLAAATVLARAWNNRAKRPLVTMCALGGLCASAALVIAFTMASAVNYPGGEAFHRLHHDAIVAPRPGRVHVDVPAAMTGVSRFGESASASSGWSYSKIEDVGVDDFYDLDFDYLLNAHKVVPGYDAVYVASGYDGMRVDLRMFPPLRAKTKPEIFIHRRRRGADQS